MTAFAIALRTRTFRSLRRHRNYRIFFTGQLVSLAGTWMQNVALAWLVLELSGSPLAVGVLAFWRFLPFTIFGLVAGVIADRVDSRRSSMATQGAAMVVSVALAVVTLTGTATLPIVYVLAALGGITLAFDAPGRQSLTFQMVGPRELPNAVALNAGLFNGSRVIGPAIAGVDHRRRRGRASASSSTRSASSRCSRRSRSCGRTSCTRSSAIPSARVVDGTASGAALRVARPAAAARCSAS